MAGRVEGRDGRSDRDGLSGADVTGDHAEGGLDDAEVDAGDGFLMRLAAEQVLGGDGLAERGARRARSGPPTVPGSLSSPPRRGSEHGELGEVDLRPGAGRLLVGGGHQPEVVDPGRGRLRPGRLGNGAVGVAPDDERGRHAGRLAVQEDVDAGEVLGVIAQLDAPADRAPGRRA